jgi:hypothetical protein
MTDGIEMKTSIRRNLVSQFSGQGRCNHSSIRRISSNSTSATQMSHQVSIAPDRIYPIAALIVVMIQQTMKRSIETHVEYVFQTWIASEKVGAIGLELTMATFDRGDDDFYPMENAN